MQGNIFACHSGRTVGMPTTIASGWRIFLCTVFITISAVVAVAQHPRFSVIALAENGGHHLAYTQRAQQWLSELGSDSNFSIRYLSSTDSIDENLLAGCNLFIQLDYPPYAWSKQAVAAFERYIDQGRGAWIGFHHASLLGEFDGYPMWKWFYGFMGSIRFKGYIAAFADATVFVEDTAHPVFRNLPHRFKIEKEEWYTYDRSPRPDVHVLAQVDEQTYEPASDIRMGDHPVIWTNPHRKARNVYIFMGHSPALFDDINYTTLFRNAIFWAVNLNGDGKNNGSRIPPGSCWP